MKGARFWIITLAAVASAALTTSLGFWQWGRAQQKIALHDVVERQKSLPAIEQSGLLATKNIADWVHRPVRLRGQWMPKDTVYLDNRQMQGQPGFYVLTPLRLEGSASAIVVQRGWAPRNFLKRDALPLVDTPEGVVELQGHLAPPPSALYAFAPDGQGPIRQNLDLAAYAAETGLSLLPLTVQQSGPASEGLRRDWPQAGSGAEKNYGYAFQWWALAALIVLLYVWFQLIAPRRRRT